MASTPISVVVPTYKEAQNLPVLYGRLRQALDAAGRPFDPDRMHAQASNLLAFHAWLDANDRR